MSGVAHLEFKRAESSFREIGDVDDKENISPVTELLV